jgi:hypothetical protein
MTAKVSREMLHISGRKDRRKPLWSFSLSSNGRQDDDIIGYHTFDSRFEVNFGEYLSCAAD